MTTTLLDPTVKQETSYAIPLWLRDEQIRLNIQRVTGRIQPHYALRGVPIAVACFGPSLSDTWEQIKDFPFVISCSGAHKFLIDRGVVPNFHLEVDPRAHKIQLIGQPHPDVEYLISSTCHPDVIKHLTGFNIKLWHVFDTAEEGKRLLPHGEWALTGGCSVGLRALTMARFLGFTDLHVFGMDGSEGKTGKHASEHPNQAKKSFETVYNGVTYKTTPGFLEAARTTFHELDQMTDVKVTFYGEGLVQAMAKDYVPNHKKGYVEIAIEKPELISAEYRRLNAQLHQDNLAYGVGAGKHAPVVKKLVATLKGTDGLPPAVLDYGAGKRYLSKALPFPIFEYDPAIPAIAESPRPADLVCCLDVLEHIEPDKLLFVLDDLRRCVKQIGYFVINTKAAGKTLPDGRNTHLIQQGREWWTAKLSAYFTVAKMMERGAELHTLVSPKPIKKHKRVQQISALAVKALAPKPMALTFGALQMRREPYVIGATQGVLTQTHYQELAATFPMDLSLYKSFIGGDKKFSSSERNNPEGYHAFVQSSPTWKALYDYLKAPTFVEKMVRVLTAHKVPLSVTAEQLRTRFEFSLLPADGGLLRPHTDIPSKVITLVIAMPTPGEMWDPAWGGGTDVLAQVDPTQSFPDYGAPEDALIKAHTYEYLANQCVVFVKSEKSWHSVGPLAGPEGKWRRSITVNLERV